MSKVTVQSLADLLGLSKFAVSRALSGKSGVSEETRRLVVEVAEKQGYRPRNARKTDTLPVRVLVQNHDVAKREVWIDVRNGIEFQAAKNGLELEFVFTESPDEVKALASSSKGIIMLGPMARTTYETVQSSDVPAVAVAHDLPPLMSIDQIGCTNAESGAAVGEFLIAKGHRKLVYVHGQPGFPGRVARLRGLELVASKVDSVEIREIVFPEDYTPSNFAADVRKMVMDGFLPTCFFCGSDGVAVTVMNELHRMGINVPLDCSVVGHANYPLATQVTPNLTTVHMPNRELGMEAVRLLGKHLEGSEGWLGTGGVQLCLVANIAERESTSIKGTPDWHKALSCSTHAVQ
ncbi:MAG: LacI family DNA-binding transcriptional regulator [Paracoccaceae bacterium]